MSSEDQIIFENINLNCPITGKRFIKPVKIKNEPSYEEEAAISTLNGKLLSLMG